MNSGRWRDLADEAWEDFGKGTHGIQRKGLLPPEISWGSFRAVLTRAVPGGIFPVHTDDYHHIFFVIQGTGAMMVCGERFPLRPGRSAFIYAGEEHGYENTDTEYLIMITLNIPTH